MEQVYVLVYAYNDDTDTLSDFVFFSSEEEAWDWKKREITTGNCGNQINDYRVIKLESL